MNCNLQTVLRCLLFTAGIILFAGIAYSGSRPDLGTIRFQGECVDIPALLDYIEQWERGEITIPIMMEKLAEWKSGEGCQADCQLTNAYWVVP